MRLPSTATFLSSGYWIPTLWLAIILVLNPIREFPLNDDWAYALSVHHCLQTGTFDPGDWPGMTLLLQVLWGALFCKIFGFSFAVLRCSVLVLGIAGSWCFFHLSKKLVGGLFWPVMVTLTAIFNPLFLSLSFSFMTDVSFWALSAANLYLYYQAFQKDSGKYWWAATALAMIAVLLRQFALMWPLAFALPWFLRKLSWQSALQAFAGLVLCWGTLKGYVYYMEQHELLSPTFGSVTALIKGLTFNYLKYRLRLTGGLVLYNTAVFLLPILLLAFMVRRKLDILLLVLSAIPIIIFGKISWYWLPSGNVFFNAGIGPLVLPNANNHWSPDLVFPRWMFVLPGLLGAWLLLQIGLVRLIDIGRKAQQWPATRWWKIGLVFAAIGFWFFLLIDNFQFDRYFMPLTLVLLLLLVPRHRVGYFRKGMAITALLLMGLFALAATHDHLQWNQARWNALNELMEQRGIPPENIDGGFEFNGWFQSGPRNPYIKGSKSWWFVVDDEYAVSFDTFGCHQIMEAHPYHSLLKPYGDTLYTLKRSALTRGDTLFCDMEQLNADSSHLQTMDKSQSFELTFARDTALVHSGDYALRLSPEHPFAMTTYLTPVQPCEQFTFTLWNYGKPKVTIVATTPDEKAYRNTNTRFVDQRHDGWERNRFEVTLPSDYPSDSLKVYLWNNDSREIVVDDFGVVWKRRMD